MAEGLGMEVRRVIFAVFCLNSMKVIGDKFLFVRNGTQVDIVDIFSLKNKFNCTSLTVTTHSNNDSQPPHTSKITDEGNTSRPLDDRFQLVGGSVDRISLKSASEAMYDFKCQDSKVNGDGNGRGQRQSFDRLVIFVFSVFCGLNFTASPEIVGATEGETLLTGCTFVCPSCWSNMTYPLSSLGDGRNCLMLAKQWFPAAVVAYCRVFPALAPLTPIESVTIPSSIWQISPVSTAELVTHNHVYWTPADLIVRFSTRNVKAELEIAPAGSDVIDDNAHDEQWFLVAHLRCFADGHPKPELNWINVDTGIVHNGSTLNVSIGRLKKLQRQPIGTNQAATSLTMNVYQCVATNVVGNKEHVQKSAELYVPVPDSELENGYVTFRVDFVVAVSVVATISALCLLAVALICFVCCRRKQGVASVTSFSACPSKTPIWAPAEPPYVIPLDANGVPEASCQRQQENDHQCHECVHNELTVNPLYTYIDFVPRRPSTSSSSVQSSSSAVPPHYASASTMAEGYV